MKKIREMMENSKSLIAHLEKEIERMDKEFYQKRQDNTLTNDEGHRYVVRIDRYEETINAERIKMDTLRQIFAV